MIIISKKLDISLDVSKLLRVSQKIFQLLTRKTKTAYEAYAILLILKMDFDEEFEFTEDDFKPLLDELKRLEKDDA